MKFSTRISPVVATILWLVFAVSVVGTVFGILLLAGINIPFTGGVEQGKIFVLTFPFPAILALLFSTTHYRVTDTTVQMRIWFVDMLGGKALTP